MRAEYTASSFILDRAVPEYARLQMSRRAAGSLLRILIIASPDPSKGPWFLSKADPTFGLVSNPSDVLLKPQGPEL